MITKEKFAAAASASYGHCKIHEFLMKNQTKQPRTRYSRAWITEQAKSCKGNIILFFREHATGIS
jgi:hypothetical protein